MTQKEMIEQLERNADALQGLFTSIEREKNINSGNDLINLSQEIRAVYNQIFQMKYCYCRTSETEEDSKKR